MIITKETMQAVIDYLQTKPYQEVAGLINAIVQDANVIPEEKENDKQTDSENK